MSGNVMNGHAIELPGALQFRFSRKLHLVDEVRPKRDRSWRKPLPDKAKNEKRRK